MNRFAVLVIVFGYYLAWLLLPIFELEGKFWLFPLPSVYAVFLPIVLLMVGVFLVISFLGLLLIHPM